MCIYVYVNFSHVFTYGGKNSNNNNNNRNKKKVCFSRHDLSAHNAATHKQDPRPYRCEQCGRQFSTCAYLSQHRRIHTGVKPYACRYCDRRFTQLSHVQQHERIHTVCEISADYKDPVNYVNFMNERQLINLNNFTCFIY
ncbi:uncharacterized protein DC041_0005347 [Schistosoma bovis]|uniref:C2H2-type domain-containing protein n=1 Tax=Schistosoma bovis TaxID=6184 RepID=A0A430QU10_SCHBO|nr:uncharacterized protein DC041_0005347 [Schistosoma bovis]